MEEIYNKWQLTELELKKIQPVRFTKEELLDFANYYHKQQLILHNVINWVAVEDRLPPKYENVIVRDENNNVHTDQISDIGFSYAELSCLKVTHWQPLPKPPCG